MSTWIPENQRNTAWYLFNKLFMCRVSNIQSMSVEFIQKFGMPASGDAGYDSETANELVIRMLTIDQIAEFFNKGVTVQVVKYEDTKLIYELISDHLNDWKQKLSTSFHTRDAPIDDLLLLDKLAIAVYKHAASQFDTKMVESLLARRSSTVLRTNRENILKPPKINTINPIGEPIPDKSKERPSLAESFAAHRPQPSISAKWR